MDRVQVYVDESGFLFPPNNPSEVDEAILALYEVIDTIVVTDVDLVVYEEIWDAKVIEDECLADFLYSAEPLFSPEPRRLLARQLDKLLGFRPLSDELPLRDVCVGGAPVKAGDHGIVRAAATLLAGTLAAVVGTPYSRYAGSVLEVSTDEVSSKFPLYTVISPVDYKEFWRDSFTASGVGIREIENWADCAFPSLKFVDGVWNGASRFVGDRGQVLRQLVRHLAALDDHFLPILESTNDPARIAAEMSSTSGVSCSKESNSTRNNGPAMAERIRQVKGKPVSFEWHTKLERHQNRVHFAIVDRAVWVGIFTDHLST